MSNTLSDEQVDMILKTPLKAQAPILPPHPITQQVSSDGGNKISHWELVEYGCVCVSVCVEFK